MKILVIAPTPYFSDRGCHIRIYEEAKALQARGYQPVIYTYHLGRTPVGIPVQRSRRIASYKKISAGPAGLKPFLDILLLWKILRTTKRGQYRLIHAHLPEGAAIGIVVRWWLKCPLVIDLQSELVNELQSYGWAKHGIGIIRWFERWLLRRADWIVTSSDRATAEMLKLDSTIQNKLTLLRDGVSRIFSETNSVNTPIIQRSATTIIYAGGMGPAKGFEIFLNALGQLKQRQLNFSVLCIGPANETIKRSATDLGLTHNVTWRAAVPYEKLLPVLALGAIAVDPKPPTTTEGSGKLLNYMAAGLA
ncbi:MAG: glycosyl transferase, group 1, partial [uncultured bacterium]